MLVLKKSGNLLNAPRKSYEKASFDIMSVCIIIVIKVGRKIDDQVTQLRIQPVKQVFS